MVMTEAFERNITDALEGAEEGINDIIARGMDYDDEMVANMVKDDIEYAKSKGATVKDFEKLAAKMNNSEASEIIKSGLKDAYGNSYEYQKLKNMYDKCSSFIRSIYNHTEGDDRDEYDILRAEMNSLSNRADKIITELDAFEQNDLGRN